jgi:uncharacterized membrane protein YeaQ/YmgE (transglycosylase-associated protein family)
MISLILVAFVLTVLILLFFFVPLLHVLGWFLVGLIAYCVVRLFDPSIKKLEAWKTLLLGVAGSLIGGWLGSLLSFETGVLGSILTAALILYLWTNAHKLEKK